MSTEEHKALIRRYVDCFQEFWRTGNVDLVDEFLAPDLVNHTPGMPPDRAGLMAVMPMFRAAFPDLDIRADDIVAKDDKVVLRLTNRGTHTGPLMNIPPTGRTIEIGEIHIYRIAGGKIVERWGVWDQLGLLQQIGAVPGPPEAVV